MLGLRKVSLPVGLTQGSLYLSIMPGRFQPLEYFFEDLRKAKVATVLCLVSDEEISWKSPNYHAALSRGAVPAQVMRYDIPDFGLPDDAAALDQTLDLVRQKLDAGESIVIHCAGGRGRTGMVSMPLLTWLGLPLTQAIDLIRQAGSDPDTYEQLSYVRTHAKSERGLTVGVK